MFGLVGVDEAGLLGWQLFWKVVSVDLADVQAGPSVRASHPVLLIELETLSRVREERPRILADVGCPRRYVAWTHDVLRGLVGHLGHSVAPTIHLVRVGRDLHVDVLHAGLPGDG